jgi:hypothetical protein
MSSITFFLDPVKLPINFQLNFHNISKTMFSGCIIYDFNDPNIYSVSLNSICDQMAFKILYSYALI